MCDHYAVEARKHEGEKQKPTIAERTAGSKGYELKTEGEAGVSQSCFTLGCRNAGGTRQIYMTLVHCYPLRGLHLAKRRKVDRLASLTGN